jgi:hypothetical protein
MSYHIRCSHCAHDFMIDVLPPHFITCSKCGEKSRTRFRFFESNIKGRLLCPALGIFAGAGAFCICFLSLPTDRDYALVASVVTAPLCFILGFGTGFLISQHRGWIPPSWVRTPQRNKETKSY